MDVVLTTLARSGPYRLVSLPHVLLRFLELYDSGDVRREQVAEIVSRDAALCARVMTIACAASTAGTGSVPGVEEALEKLSPDALKSLAIGASGHPILLRHADKWLPLLKRIWLRSVSCALLARSLAILVQYDGSDEAYLAGLLHNMGQLALGAHAPTQYPNLLTAERNDNRLLQLEKSHFGVNYCQAGASIVRDWNLRSFLADAIQYQAGPVERLHDAHALVRILHVARGLSSPTNEERELAVSAAQALFEVAPVRVLGLIQPAEQRAAEAARSFDIRLDAVGTDEDLPAARDKAIQLSHRVRNVASLDGVTEPLRQASNEAELVGAIQQGIEILLGARDTAVFLCRSERNTLTGHSRLDRAGLLEALTIPVESGASLPAQTLAENRVLHSAESDAEARLTIVDRQLLGQLDAQSMLCAPMMAEGDRIGVLVLGLDRDQLPYPQEQLMLLRQFAQRAAIAIRELPGAVEGRRETPVQAAGPVQTSVREIVHEVRNPLTTVKNYLQILSQRTGDEEQVQKDLRIIGEEIERVDGILQRLSDISRGRRTVAAPGDINQSVSDLVRVLQPSRLDPAGIKVTLDLDADLLPVIVNRDELKQVLTNLINNAAEALEQGGELRVRTRDGVNFDGGTYVEVQVADNGPGIPPAIMERLFQRVSSPKGEGHAGLGLYIVKDLVKGMGGLISCRSSAVDGTTFTILLPRQIEAEANTDRREPI